VVANNDMIFSFLKMLFAFDANAYAAQEKENAHPDFGYAVETNGAPGFFLPADYPDRDKEDEHGNNKHKERPECKYPSEYVFQYIHAYSKSLKIVSLSFGHSSFNTL